MKGLWARRWECPAMGMGGDSEEWQETVVASPT